MYLFIYLFIHTLKVITLLSLKILALPIYLFIPYAFLHKENTMKFWNF